MWNDDFGGSGTVVGTYISYLRRKLNAFGPDLIHTERGVGFGLRHPGRVVDIEARRPA